jgi:uncharacterized protein (UPF0332 family)
MTFNWKDYLTFAENLQAAPNTPGPEEAALRSAVSRAYYSAFRAALEYGKKNGYTATRTGEDHNKIREYFRNIQTNHAKNLDISTQLNRLHDYRRQADYENTLKTKPENMIVYAISMAKKVFQNIEDLSKQDS